MKKTITLAVFAAFFATNAFAAQGHAGLGGGSSTDARGPMARSCQCFQRDTGTHRMGQGTRLGNYQITKPNGDRYNVRNVGGRVTVRQVN